MPNHDRDVLRPLAARWMELASQPAMAERRRLWTALKDLRGERPMVLFETWSLEDYLADVTLECQDPLFRGVEWHMRWVIRHAEEVGDDTVLDPCWRVGWDVQGTGYGVPIQSHHATDEAGASTAYAFDHPIRTVEDIDRLRPQTWSVNRQSTQERLQRLCAAFGDLLPVELHGTTGMHAGLTSDLFRLIGNDRLMTWPYDAPDALHRVMAYLRDDRLRLHAFLQEEGLLGRNDNSTLVGSGSPGYVSCLPQEGFAGRARLKDLWLWMESQETTCISPAMFRRFFLPYMADVSRSFGLVYYGCCEPVHDRWDAVVEAIPNVRAVSISPWCDMPMMAGKLGRSCVFSRKPRPAPITGPTADWEGLEQDIDATLEAAKGCNLEIVFRDVYRICGDRPRLRRWAEMVRSKIE